MWLLLIVLGAVIVQGARHGNQKENPMHTYDKRRGKVSMYTLITSVSCSLGFLFFLFNLSCGHGNKNEM